jgi:hypothetical protein
MLIDISDLNKAEVLMALYNASHPQGMGFFQYAGDPLTIEKAEEYLQKNTYFDYLNGRVLKVDLKGDELNPALYDRDNGEGAAYRVIMELRHTGDTNSKTTQDIHQRSTEAAVDEARKSILPPKKE